MLEMHSFQSPRLRQLDVRSITQQGRPYISLSDPLQLTDKQLLIPQQLATALAFCDGHREMDEICLLFRERSGLSLEPVQLGEVLTALDEAYMLDNPRFAEMKSETRRLYRKASCRQPTLAGRAYPAEADALQKLFDDYLARVPAESVPEETTRAETTRAETTRAEATRVEAAQIETIPVRGLLSPHIDYQRGGSVYAQVWKEAEPAANSADLVIIFGTDHDGSDPFTLTQQSYATPYGSLPNPEAITDALAEVIGPSDAYAGELRHRGEHSLELVLTWLHHMRRGYPCDVVPILVGDFHHFIQTGRSPKDDPLLNSVLDTLCSVAKNRRVLVVASGDLAHVGPAFSGPALDAVSRETLWGADQRLIEQMQAGDQDGFFEEIRHVEDDNNVCGVSPIYLTMALIERMSGPIKGALAGYQSCPADYQDTSAVTVGGIIFR